MTERILTFKEPETAAFVRFAGYAYLIKHPETDTVLVSYRPPAGLRKRRGQSITAPPEQLRVVRLA